MSSVDPQPVFDCIAATLCMFAFAFPVIIGHPFRKLRCVCPSGSSVGAISRPLYLSRRANLPGCSPELVGGLNQQLSQTYAANCFAVGQVMNNVAGAAVAGDRMGHLRISRKILETTDSFFRACPISANQFLSPMMSLLLFFSGSAVFVQQYRLAGRKTRDLL